MTDYTHLPAEIESPACIAHRHMNESRVTVVVRGAAGPEYARSPCGSRKIAGASERERRGGGNAVPRDDRGRKRTVETVREGARKRASERKRERKGQRENATLRDRHRCRCCYIVEKSVNMGHRWRCKCGYTERSVWGGFLSSGTRQNTEPLGERGPPGGWPRAGD